MNGGRAGRISPFSMIVERSDDGAPGPASAPSASLSVIIPTWNEAPLIGDAVENAWRIGDEVIVVDAGSPDGTADVARSAGAEVILTAKGRGIQLRAGAERARGDVLLFLHADARLPPTARKAILGAMSDLDLLGGGFFIRFLPASWFTRILEPGNDLRRRITHKYYGDTGIFVRRPVYLDLGGFRPWPVMHDYEFTGRMERAGRCAYIREPAIYASARRFQGREIRTLFTWITIQTLYNLGVRPERLARHYSDVRGSTPKRFMALARVATRQQGAPKPRASADAGS